MVVNMIALKKLKKKRLFNRWERMYIIIFLLSIIIGLIYGLFNISYYKNQSLPDVQSFFEIFLWNLRIGVMVFLTGGLLKLSTNIFTFAIISSSITSAGAPAMYLILLIHGIPEMLAFFLFGISGVAAFERYIFGMKSNISIKKFLFFAMIILFVAAILEWYVSIPIVDWYVKYFMSKVM